MTDNAGNTYVSANAPSTLTSSPTNKVEIWYAANSLAGATSLTVTYSGLTKCNVWLAEYSGADTVSPLDVVGTVSDAPSTNTPAAPAVTPTTSASVIFSVADVSSSVSGLQTGSPFTAMQILNGNDAAYYIANTAGSYGAIWDDPTFGPYCSSTAAFKPAP